MSDAEFWERILPIRDKLERCASRMESNPTLAEDLLQDSLVRAHKYRNGWRGDCLFATWVCIVMRSERIDQHRRRLSERETDQADYSEVPVQDTYFDSGDPLVLAEVLRSIRRSPLSHQKAFLLSHGANWSYLEIAKALKTPLGTVKSRINRATIAARKRFDVAVLGVL